VATATGAKVQSVLERTTKIYRKPISAVESPVIADVVRLYRENLGQAKALLDAPVDEPPPRQTLERVGPIHPRPEKAPQRPQLEPMSKSRREALMADLAARKARNDARLEVRADPGHD